MSAPAPSPDARATRPRDGPPDGFSWQRNGHGYWFLMDRQRNAERAKARRTLQLATRPLAYHQAEAERQRRIRARHSTALST